MSAWEAAGKSDEWYTPKYIFDALAVRFDLDVASLCRPTHVPCDDLMFSDSLNAKWFGFIFMNPPFGGRNGVALVPDRTSAPWFKWAAIQSDAILFVSPKIRFERPDGSLGKSPSTGTALIAKGQRGVNALVSARGAGLGWFCRVS